MLPADIPSMGTRAEIAALLGYGGAFTFIEEVRSLQRGAEISTLRRYSAEDPILAAHFAGGPAIVPGVIIAEQVCQSAWLLASASNQLLTDRMFLLGEIRARFRAPAVAPCQLLAVVKLTFQAWDSAAFEGIVTLGGTHVATVKGLGTFVARELGGES